MKDFFPNRNIFYRKKNKTYLKNKHNIFPKKIWEKVELPINKCFFFV